jgi:hypothetical protein
MEGVDRAHVIAVHCRETAPELIDRLMFDPKPPAVSTFPSRARAEEVVQETIDMRQEEIATWLGGPDSQEPLVLRLKLAKPTGQVLTRQEWKRGGSPVTTEFAELVLRRSSASSLGFVVVTAYPILAKATPQ